MIAFTAYFGLFLGLKFPKFDWQNETVAVKQGFAVFGTMIGSMLLSLMYFIVGLVMTIIGISFIAVGAIVTVINLGICAILHFYFSNYGAKTFAQLKH